MRWRGWQVEPDHPELHNLERAWQACVDAGIDLPEARLDRVLVALRRLAQQDGALRRSQDRLG